MAASNLRLSTIVFDIGNVLIEWNMQFLYERIFAGRPAAMRWFLANVCTPAWNLESDRGGTWREAVATLRNHWPEWRAEIEAFDHRWHEMAPRAFEGSVAILERLKRAGVPLYAITNFSGEKFAECQLRFGFFDAFDGVVVSANEGLVKPDAAIYRVLLQRYGLDPAACVFIDDSPPNVAAAHALGMSALLFNDAATLERDLRELGFDV